jgi:hypothetical protein
VWQELGADDAASGQVQSRTHLTQRDAHGCPSKANGGFLDTAGNVYITDTGNDRIRKVIP